MIYNSDNLKSRLFKVEDFVFTCFLYLLNAINVAEFKLATRVITKMLIMADTTSFTNELVLELVVLVEINWKSGHKKSINRETMVVLFLNWIWYFLESFTYKYLSKLIKHIIPVLNWRKYMLNESNKVENLHPFIW